MRSVLLPLGGLLAVASVAYWLPATPALPPSHYVAAAPQHPVGSFKHVFRPNGSTPPPLRAPSTTAAATASDLYSNGGSVDTLPAVYIDYWGPEWQAGFSTGGYTSAQAQNYINAFFQGVGGSYWLNSTTQYCQGVPYGTYFCSLGASVVQNPANQLKGVWTDSASTVPSSPTDTDIANEVKRSVSHFGLNRNAVYFVFTPTHKSESGFGTNWCAWHGFNTGYTPAPYAYMPYIPDAGGSCGENFINKTNDSFGHGYFDGFSTVGGHEYAEALTDPYPSSGWVDGSGGENGDKCAWSHTSTNTSLSTNYFAVQSLWSNSAGGCSMGSFASTSLGGIALGAPDAAASGIGSQDTFVVGRDHAVWHTHSADNTNWGYWQSLGGYATSDPSTVATDTGLATFVRGRDNAIWVNSWNGTSWSGWASVGGISRSGPDAAYLGSGAVALFCRGTDSAAWARIYNGGRWSPWFSLGGILTADPSATSAAPGHVDLFVRGADSALWHRSFDGSAWGPWTGLGGWLAGGPDSGSWGNGRLDVAMTGGDGGLWRLYFDPLSSSWSGWTEVGGNWASDPSVVDPAPGVVDFFVRGTDNATHEVVRS